MDALQLPETITVGGLLAMIITLLIWVVRSLGQRADPELIKLSNRTLDALSSLSTSIDQQTQSNREQSCIIGDLIQTVAAHNDNSVVQFRELGATYQLVNRQIIEALQAVVINAKGEHEGMKKTLDDLLSNQIVNTDATLYTRSLANEIKDTLPMLTTTEQVQLIIDRLDRLQVAIDALRGDVVARIDPLEKEITVIKSDVTDLSHRVARETLPTDEHLKVQPTVDLPVIPQPKEPEAPAEKDNGHE